MTITGQTGNWEMVIGLEVHAQIVSKSKLFSPSPTTFNSPPNANTSFIDAALPGTLPVLNMECVRQAVKTGLALNSTINLESAFDRKNYFYPDLPQGYQISQLYSPIVSGGYIDITDANKNAKRVNITRIHIEQDAGKSIHDCSPHHTYIDLNRSGMGLMEIVSEPEMKSAEEVISYVQNLRTLLQYINTCNGDLEKGSMRCDVNISVMPEGATEFGMRCELKNINSLRNIALAIDYESKRQVALIENGQEVVQETRLFNANTSETYTMRTKEDAQDYRYFPDPDLLPLEITEEFVEQIRSTIPELPQEKRKKYIEGLGLSEYDADVLIQDKEVARFFEDVSTNLPAKMCANWITGELFSYLNKANMSFSECHISTADFIELLGYIESEELSGTIAKKVLEKMFQSKELTPLQIIEQDNCWQITDSAIIRQYAQEAVEQNPELVEKYKSGKNPNAFGFFVGQVMKKSDRKANPRITNEIITELLA